MFPWHCWFLHLFESALKTKCGFQGTGIGGRVNHSFMVVTTITNVYRYV